MVWPIILIAIVVGSAVLLSSHLAPTPNIDEFKFDSESLSIEWVEVIAKSKGNFLWEELGYEVKIKLKYSGNRPVGEVLIGEYDRGVFHMGEYYSFSGSEIEVFVVGQELPFYVLILDYVSGCYVCFMVDRLGYIEGSELTYISVSEIKKEGGFINKLINPLLTHYSSIGEALVLFITVGISLLPYIGLILILWLIYPLANGDLATVFDRLRLMVEFVIKIFIKFIELIKP